LKASKEINGLRERVGEEICRYAAGMVTKKYTYYNDTSSSKMYLQYQQPWYLFSNGLLKYDQKTRNTQTSNRMVVDLICDCL